MNPSHAPRSQKTYLRFGVILILCAATVYGIAQLAGLKEEGYFGIFIINYLVAVVYGCTIIFSKRLRSGTDGLNCFLLCLVLALISAYSLNHIMPVFESSVPWLSCCLVVVAGVYTSLGYIERFRPWQRILAGFIVGVGFMLFLYLSIFLMPVCPFALFGSVFLGISLHAFVPLFFVIFTIKWLIETGNGYKYVTLFFCTGAFLALITAFVFSLQWNRIDRLASRSYSRSMIADNTELPPWMKVAQQLPDNWLTEKYLKANMVYTTAQQTNDWLEWSLPQRNFDEVRKHDPLVVIATFFTTRQTLNEEERIKILEAGFNVRHKTQERLRSGDDLVTANVITNIRLWPALRLAYTEMTLTVGRDAKGAVNRFAEQEAIYTFHLPEGSVVTALSLWIGGREEKGILTTKGKADTAYRQIVGVERRDPSVVHWQEGNTVSVRVFPVPPDGSRVFKIGVTTPLRLANNMLQYDNISFEGPDAAGAKETVQLDIEGKGGPAMPAGFEQTGPHRFLCERIYGKQWQLAFAAPAVQKGTFAFNGKTYTLTAYEPQRATADFQKIYLDLNASWTREEFDVVWNACRDREVFVFDDGLIRLDGVNASKIFKRMQGYHFSLFPLQEINDPGSALLVTKSGEEGPTIRDLKDTDFGKRLDDWLGKGRKLRLFNLGTTLNPYLRTLKEHRAFVYEQGDCGLLQQLAAGHSFAVDTESPDKIVMDNAGVLITRSDTMNTTDAPDHVQRLFAYNHVMQQLKQGLYTDHEADSLLVAEAQEAGVVSPVSSLVVLESAADYQRFDIRQSKNSLQNASMKSKGAVPEPEEWALIIIVAVLLLLLYRKNIINRLWIRY